MPLAGSSVRKVNAVDYAETFWIALQASRDSGVDRVEGSQANGEARRHPVPSERRVGDPSVSIRIARGPRARSETLVITEC
jgi:hypothetical protein